MEPISWAFAPDSMYFLATDIINQAQGLFIFALFVLKPKMLRRIKKRSVPSSIEWRCVPNRQRTLMSFVFIAINCHSFWLQSGFCFFFGLHFYLQILRHASSIAGERKQHEHHPVIYEINKHKLKSSFRVYFLPYSDVLSTCAIVFCLIFFIVFPNIWYYTPLSSRVLNVVWFGGCGMQSHCTGLYYAQIDLFRSRNHGKLIFLIFLRFSVRWTCMLGDRDGDEIQAFIPTDRNIRIFSVRRAFIPQMKM